MPLHTHQLEVTAELLYIDAVSHGRVEPGVELERPLPHLLGRPFHVAVLEQRDQVIGQRTFDGVLEVEDSRVVFLGDHEIARMVIAMDKYSRLVERIGNQHVGACLPLALVVIAQRQPEVRAAQPVMKQRHLETQQLFVVGR